MGNDLDAPPAHPIGTITMWSGFLEDIPLGWFICDGLNGTPNLLTRFLRGSPVSIDPGNTGGSDTHTLIEAEMDAHDHVYTNPTHTHLADDNGGGSIGVGSGDVPNETIGPQAASSGNTIGSIGSGNSHNSLPSYFEMAFIQKVN